MAKRDPPPLFPALPTIFLFFHHHQPYKSKWVNNEGFQIWLPAKSSVVPCLNPLRICDPEISRRISLRMPHPFPSFVLTYHFFLLHLYDSNIFKSLLEIQKSAFDSPTDAFLKLTNAQLLFIRFIPNKISTILICFNLLLITLTCPRVSVVIWQLQITPDKSFNVTFYVYIFFEFQSDKILLISSGFYLFSL